MALLSMCFPILPGKLDKWQEMIDSWNDPSIKAETDKVRNDAGVYERTFLEQTPNGDFVIGFRHMTKRFQHNTANSVGFFFAKLGFKKLVKIVNRR